MLDDFLMRTKPFFFMVFVGVQLLLICISIDKQSRFVKLAYEKQAYERKIKLLIDQEQKLINRLHALQNHAKIALFAQEKLGMKPLFLKNIKDLPQSKALPYEHHQQT